MPERLGTAALMYFKITPFLFPLPEALGDFSPIFTLNLVELLKVNLTKLWNGLRLQDWVCLESLTLRDVHTEPLANNSVTLQVFLPWHWVPLRFLQVSASQALNPWIDLSISPILGAIVCPASSPLLWIQEDLLIILIVQIFVRTE